MRREGVGGPRRVVVKVGSSSLTTAEGGIDPPRIGQLVAGLAGARLAGREIVLVSSGAIAAGLSPLGLHAGPGITAKTAACSRVGWRLVYGFHHPFLGGGGVGGGSVPTHSSCCDPP